MSRTSQPCCCCCCCCCSHSYSSSSGSGREAELSLHPSLSLPLCAALKGTLFSTSVKINFDFGLLKLSYIYLESTPFFFKYLASATKKQKHKCPVFLHYISIIKSPFNACFKNVLSLNNFTPRCQRHGGVRVLKLGVRLSCHCPFKTVIFSCCCCW